MVENNGFFVGPGEARRLARTVDWSATAIGAPSSWPTLLQSVVRLCLESPSPMAIWVGPTFTLIHNDAYGLILGAKAAWAMGRPSCDVWSEVWDTLGPEFVKVVRTREAVRYTNRPFILRRGAGEEMAFFTFMLAPLEAEAGDVLGIFNVCEETTQTIRSLAHTLGKHEALVKSMDLGFALVEVYFEDGHASDAVVLEANAALERTTGLHTPVGRRLREMVPDIERHWLELLERVVIGGEAEHIEEAMLGVDRFFEVNAFRIGAPESRQLVLLFNDISERKRAEQTLRESGERQAFLLRLHDAMRPLADPAEVQFTAARVFGEYLDADRVFHADVLDEQEVVISRDYVRGVPSLAGRSPIEVFGESVLQAMRGTTLIIDDVAHDARLCPSTRSRFEAAGVAAAMITSLVKGRRWVASFAVHSSRPRRWRRVEIELLDEVAERTWVVAERAQQERRKSEFLGVLSHELRNPLAALRNYLTLLERAQPHSDRYTRATTGLRHQTDLLSRLVDDLLDVTRISKGKIQLQRSRVDLHELVLTTTRDMQLSFTERELAFELALACEPLEVDGDPVRLAQVLANLLHNAVKFTPERGTITVALTRVGERAQLRVRDSGEGISQAMLERVFEPFVQTEQGLARSQGGLGIGLALVKGFVELHGGEVSASSPGLGQGAEFVVELPLSPG